MEFKNLVRVNIRINFNVATLNEKVNATGIKNQKNVTFRGNENGNDAFIKRPTTFYQKGSLEWARNWNADDRKKELDNEFEKNKKAMSFWKRNFTSAVPELKISYDKTFENEKIMVMTLLQNETSIQNKIDRLNIEKSELEKKAVTVAKKEEQVKKLSDASKIANAFKVENEGGLDDSIAGYDAEKQLIRNSYIEQVALEKAGNDAEVPNAILLYGPIGTGKTAMSKAAVREAGAFLVELNPDINDLSVAISKCLQEAKERYLDTEQRTVIIVNETDIPISNTATNAKNIGTLKSWLDTCAKLPEDENDNGFATTFFFTTNHANEITDELLYREEKIAQRIAFEPAAEDNIKKIIEFYLNKLDENGFAIENEKIDYDKIIQLMNPDDEKGAFGNDKIKAIVKRAFTDFNRDTEKEKTLEEHLIERIDTAKRNILPDRLRDFKEQVEEISED